MGAVLLLGAIAAAAFLFGKKGATAIGAAQWRALMPGATIAVGEYLMIAFDAPAGWGEPARLALLMSMQSIGFDLGGETPTSEEGLPHPKPANMITILARWHGDKPLLLGSPQVLVAPPATIPTANFRAWVYR